MPYSEPWYLPSQEEVAFRAMVLRMMMTAEWPIEVVDSVMLRDHPSTGVVIGLVTRYGHDGALHKIQDWL